MKTLLALFLLANALPPEEAKIIQNDYEKMAVAPGEVMFTPPQGWKMADPKVLTPHVKIMVVGEGGGTFPPSINLAYDPFKGTLKEYLKLVKAFNDAERATWKDLGTIRTEAGEASLSQVDTATEWGMERQMQVIFLKDNTAWILTCSALKDDFSRSYKEFFAAMKSLRINKKD